MSKFPLDCHRATRTVLQDPQLTGSLALWTVANPDPTLILYSMLEKAEAKAMSDDGGSLALRDMCDDCDDGDGSDRPDRISRYTEVDSCKRQFL